MFPAESVAVTDTFTLVSAFKSAPSTAMVYLPPLTVPVTSLPFTCRVTVSPSFTSPLTAPVTFTLAPDSAAFITLSVVIESTVIPAVAVKSTATTALAGLAAFPARSVTFAVIASCCPSVKPATALAGTVTENLPLDTVPV